MNDEFMEEAREIGVKKGIPTCSTLKFGSYCSAADPITDHNINPRRHLTLFPKMDTCRVAPRLIKLRINEPQVDKIGLSRG